MTKSQFFTFTCVVLALLLVRCGNPDKAEQPNVILIMTDDQGFGDLGFYGNPHVKTPVIDKLASESVRFDEFLVSPVCAPTRSALLTGRYPLRTGVCDTYKGGAIMASSEITIAEMLKDAGYTTGMIGKWHLGDNYPCRPEDQGFDYALHHLAGGMGQWGDWPNHLKGDSCYFNPTLWENGKRVENQGYCSDVFTDAAIHFIEEEKEDPFFLYLAFNAPHDPLQLPQKYYDLYKDIDPSKGFEDDDRPFPNMTESQKEEARKVYGMVTNIDDNLARLFQKMDELKLNENTLVIFMTDNGPLSYRYLAGMRGLKSSVYQGGIRVPSFWHFPKAFKGNRDVKTTAAHFDIFPTLAELCGGQIPSDRKMDGLSLLPLLKGEQNDLEERSICRYWTRQAPEKFKNMMIHDGEFKLVGNCDETAGIEKFDLFNLANDPYELTNVVENNKEKAIALKTKMNSWIEELQASPNALKSPRIIIGTKHENPSILNLNDVHFTAYKDLKEEVVYWKTEIATEGNYEVNLYFKKAIEADCEVELQIGNEKHAYLFQKPMSSQLSLGSFHLRVGDADIVPVVILNTKDKKNYTMPFYVEVKKH
jgi:arylsulfatase